MADVTQSKRFIAGAVCPACNALDRVYILKTPAEDRAADAESVAGEVTRVCAACGATERMHADGHSRSGIGAVPRGKHEKVSGGATESQPVRILDPGAGRK